MRLDAIYARFSLLQQDLLSIFVNKDFDDVFLWKSNPRGNFIVASAHKNTFTQTNNSIWTKIWNRVLIPKVNMFFWLAVHNRILTIDNLARRGFMYPNRCELCQKEKESMDHLFIHCSFTWEIWSKFWAQWKVEWVMHNSLKEVIWQWIFPTKYPPIKNL